MDSYISSITIWPPTFAPAGTEFCRGQLISIDQSVALFSLIAAVYGGDGRINFGLPNFKGRVPLGIGEFTSSFGNYNFVQGMKIGAPGSIAQVTTSTDITLIADNLPGHTHPATFTPAKSDVPIDLKVRGDQRVNIPVGATVPTATTPATLSGPQYLSNYQAGLQSSKGGFVNTPPVSTVNLATGIGGVTVTGGAGVTASPTINVVTGGTVAVQSQTLNSAPTPIHIAATGLVTTAAFQPSLAMNFIITMIGYYPARPD
ncbi:MAG: tail fiber protein [Tagaea sp.]|nr:tail fiber protein [Tagaea sp.]